MRPRERVKRELVGEWLARAEADLAVAQQLLGAGDVHAWAVAFHCQQAAEKFLKAFLVRWQIEFPKTHDLGQILELAAMKDRALARDLRGTADLTSYGVDVRYPGDFPRVAAGDAEEALRLAGQVRDRVLKVLEPYLAAGED